ncbi:hypothetical protein BGX21_005719, partial [Mortierella sp. AD011]
MRSGNTFSFFPILQLYNSTTLQLYNSTTLPHITTGPTTTSYNDGVVKQCAFMFIADLHFTNGQYLLSDSAYPTSRITITPFKGQSLDENQTDFNTCVAHVPVINEQCIGVLKNKWKSLMELPITTQSEETEEEGGHDERMTWISVCAILYNFMIDERDVGP